MRDAFADLPNHLRDRIAAARRVPVRPGGLRYAVALGELRCPDDLPDWDLDRLAVATETAHGPLAAASAEARGVPRLVRALSGMTCRVVGRLAFDDGPAVRGLRDRVAALAADGADEAAVALPAGVFRSGSRSLPVALVSSAAAALAGRPLTVVLDASRFGTAADLDAAARLAVEEGAAFVQALSADRPWSGALAALAVVLEVLRGRNALGLRPDVGVKLSGLAAVEDVIAALALTDAMLGRTALRPGMVRVDLPPDLLDRVLTALASGPAPRPAHGA